jgi:Skp family chaperone for outer membrane proteins
MASHPTPPGVGEMKTILLLSLILAVIATASTAAQASGTIGIDSTISQMKQDLQIQVERIRRARETASSEMTLARIRIAEQLRRSEEDLSRQIESLERFREQMADQKGETDQAVVRMQKDWKQFIQQAFSDLDSQLRETNSLITQMEALRDRFDVDPDELPQPTKEQIMTPSAPQPPANPQPVTPTPTVTQTPPANPEPATTTPTVTAATPTSTGST